MAEHRAATDWGGVLLGLAVASLAAFQMLKLAPALPVMIRDYGYGRVLAGGLMSGYAGAGLLLSVAVGRLLTRRPMAMLAIGLGVFVLGNLATLAFPGSGWLVLAARGVEGIGYAVLGIAGPVIANRSATESHHPLVAGIVAIWVPVGQIAALAAAWLTLDRWGWQPLWWLSVLLTVGAGLWLLARRHTVVTALGRQHRTHEVHWSGTERLLLWFAAGVFALWGGQYLAFMTWLPDQLVTSRGVSAQMAALTNLIPVFGVLVSCLATGWLLRRGLPFGLLFLGATLAQVPVWLFAPGLGPVAGGLAIGFFGLACGVTPTLLFALPPRVLGGHRVTTDAFAPMMTGRNLGLLAAPVIAGWLVDGWGARMLGTVFGSVTLVAALGGGLLALGAARAGR